MAQVPEAAAGEGRHRAQRVPGLPRQVSGGLPSNFYVRRWMILDSWVSLMEWQELKAAQATIGEQSDALEKSRKEVKHPPRSVALVLLTICCFVFAWHQMENVASNASSEMSNLVREKNQV